MTPEIAKGYSNPFEAFDEAWHRRWVCAYYSRQIASFAEQSSSALERMAPGTRVLLCQLSQELACVAQGQYNDDDCHNYYELVWHPSSNPRSLVADEAGNPVVAAARAVQLVLRMAQFRPGLVFRVQLPSPVSFEFAHFRLPLTRTLCVEGTQTGVVRIDGEDRSWSARFQCSDGQWCVSGSSVHRHACIPFCGGDIVLSALPRSILKPDTGVIDAGDEIASRLRSALAQVSATSGAYERWLARTLRVVSPLSLASPRFESETYEMVKGALYMTLHDDVTRCAETLVHEVSHDYLHLLLTMGPLTDASSGETFYSPPRRTHRPTLGILKAHHAFSNVLLFYYLLQIAEPTAHAELTPGIQQLEQWREQLEGSLMHSNSLTELGTILWQSLSRRIDQFGLFAKCILS